MQSNKPESDTWFAVDWALNLFMGVEIGRVKSGDKETVALKSPYRIELIPRERVFETEMTACLFVIKEYQDLIAKNQANLNVMLDKLRNMKGQAYVKANSELPTSP